MITLPLSLSLWYIHIKMFFFSFLYIYLLTFLSDGLPAFGALSSWAALRMLDADNNGSVEFSEFVSWYCGVVALECSVDGCDPY